MGVTASTDTGRLRGRRVVLGVSGGIAAYKAVEICRRLMDAGASVRVAMTPDATRFVGALTFSALTGHPAGVSLWDGPELIPHTQLGQWAELIVVAPATARLLGSYAAGISDDLLTATLLATRAPVVVCPAMHTEMWEHRAVQDNMERLRGRGVVVVAPEIGRLAGGDEGPGRLADSETIVAAAAAALGVPGTAEVPATVLATGEATVLATGEAAAPGTPRPDRPGVAGDLAGVRVLVTAGGTREPIDPVRFLGNRSSGKQGIALAAEAARRGAAVTLISTVVPAGAMHTGGGPTGSTSRPGPRAGPGDSGIDVVEVETAEDMGRAVAAHAPASQVVIMAAAVADFRPKVAADQKLKKVDGVPELVLEPTPDILAELGRRRSPGQVLVGFAAETANGDPAQLRARAEEKLSRKHLDFVVANDVSVPSVGFGHDTNAVLIVSADGKSLEVGLTDKSAIAGAILDAVAAHLSGHDPGGCEP